MTAEQLKELFPNASDQFIRGNADDMRAVTTVERTRKVRKDIGSKRPRHIQVCQQCGKGFHAANSIGRKYCSHECAYASPTRSAHIKPKDRGTAICGRCTREFPVTHRSPRGLFCSQTCAAAVNSNGRHGWTEVGGQRFYTRSRWEGNYARYLEWQRQRSEIAKWEYEPETFWFEAIKRGTRSYLPDFRVTLNDGTVQYHEVKGWMDPRSLTKLKRMRIYHPTITVVLIDAPRYRALSAAMINIIPGWVKAK